MAHGNFCLNCRSGRPGERIDNEEVTGERITETREIPGNAGRENYRGRERHKYPLSG